MHVCFPHDCASVTSLPFSPNNEQTPLMDQSIKAALPIMFVSQQLPSLFVNASPPPSTTTTTSQGGRCGIACKHLLECGVA